MLRLNIRYGEFQSVLPVSSGNFLLGLTKRYKLWESETLKGFADGFKLQIFESLRDI